ncbi:MAG TPA: hypothetical protein VM118_04350 [Acidobacteriota bacterium]|nr:hypothetical protein [Acidobacteriota bacterium]
MKHIARKCGLLVLLSAWTLWVQAAGAVPKVLCFSGEDQVRLETSVNGSCRTEASATTHENTAADQSTCGDCADLALVLDVSRQRTDTPELAATSPESSLDPPDFTAASDPGRDDLLRSRQFLRQRTLPHHPHLSRSGSLPLIC